MLRLSICALVISLLATACSGVDESVGHVTAITLDPSAPAAGQKVRVYVELYDPYMYNGLDVMNPNPRVTLQVTGGSVEGQDRATTNESWQPQEGTSIIVYPQAAMYWTLPSMPGTYKLTVGFDGNTKTKRVEIR